MAFGFFSGDLRPRLHAFAPTGAAEIMQPAWKLFGPFIRPDSHRIIVRGGIQGKSAISKHVLGLSVAGWWQRRRYRRKKSGNADGEIVGGFVDVWKNGWF